jgi:RNA polymerase sigma factor (sigma-70 family)
MLDVTEAISAEHFETAFRAHHAKAVRHCAREFGDRALAEEAVQDAFAEMFARTTRGQPVLTTLASVIRFSRWNAQKHKSRERSREGRNAAYCMLTNTDQEWVRTEARELVVSICTELPLRDREVLYLRFVEQQSHETVAQRLGITVKAAERRADRALCHAREVALSN